MKWEMDLEEMEMVLLEIWELHDEVSDAAYPRHLQVSFPSIRQGLRQDIAGDEAG
ncbi:hypothetical protein DsansV1_C11g0109321 [Dioscorea sansibarensis]